jgi:hypothetical protein
VQFSKPRFVRKDIQLGGIRLKKGDKIMVMVAASAWTRRRTEHPEKLDLQRHPNRHLPVHALKEPSLRRRHGINLASLVVGVLSAIALSDPTAARIQCQGNFQITKYGPIATPYCEDEQIAIVAQSYGLHISASEIHNDPLKKIQVCQALSSDARLKGACPVRGSRNG